MWTCWKEINLGMRFFSYPLFKVSFDFCFLLNFQFNGMVVVLGSSLI